MVFRCGVLCLDVSREISWFLLHQSSFWSRSHTRNLLLIPIRSKLYTAPVWLPTRQRTSLSLGLLDSLPLMLLIGSSEATLIIRLLCLTSLIIVQILRTSTLPDRLLTSSLLRGTLAVPILSTTF
ncbi:hypothetical protein L6452_28501 [Arctium lappa]|uniref:Uncharacterized protein n=1 Tax=Arctium lappa TaxID=4217 RepID=A0ACB8ZXQ2_ARCLA|nr:hypothetical protein L6452_28501 [Arctium lappa]